MHGHFSVKSDVFSFGVLVLEIVTGHKNGDIHKSGYVEHLISFVRLQSLSHNFLVLKIVHDIVRMLAGMDELEGRDCLKYSRSNTAQ